MSKGGFFAVARFVCWRNLRVLVRRPALFAPTSSCRCSSSWRSPAPFGIAKLPEFGSIDYTAFQYVYALMQAAAFAGAVGGTAMTDDVVNGFMDRLMVTAPKRAGIVFGYVAAMFIRAVIAAIVLTGAAFALGMHVKGGPLDMLGLIGLAALINLTAALWSTGIAMHIRNINATARRDPADLPRPLPDARLPAAPPAARLAAHRRDAESVHAADRGRRARSSRARPRTCCWRSS